MPSGRWKGPEKRSKTVLEECAGAGVSGARVGRLHGQPGRLVEAVVVGGDGDRRVDCWSGRFPGERVFIEVNLGGEYDARHTGHVHVVRTCPGVVRLRPRLMPTHARGSMRVFE
eukprot:2436775-Pleurochrysis_carterae.AAC.1